jgi:crossover junction endodeoxyribonuclease RuvC
VALDGDEGVVLDYLDTPTLTVKGARGRSKREYDLGQMAEWMQKWFHAEHRFAVIEQVHAMPGQGVRSMFSMGYGLGAWDAILAACQIPTERVPPQRWKRALLQDMGRDKDASRLRALQLYPDLGEFLRLKKSHGRAEALLLATYGRRIALASTSLRERHA